MSHYDPDDAPTAEEIAQRMKDGDEILHINEAAEFLRTYPNTLRDWRTSEYGPRSFLLGRYVAYFKFDLFDWLAEQAANPKRSNGGRPRIPQGRRAAGESRRSREAG